MDVPWRRDFDAARDPYTARNALGITTMGGGGGAPVSAEYITSSSDATLTNERVLTDTATITWDFSTAGQAKANIGATPTPGSISFQGATFQSVSATSFTLSFSSVSSAAGKERLVGIVVTGFNGGGSPGPPGTVTITACAIDGQAATQVGAYVRHTE